MTNRPGFADLKRVGTLFYPDAGRIAADARAAGLPLAADDEAGVHLLIIDMQVDFCHEQGALYVPGAPDDIRRLIAFIYRHAERITDITCSLDSHLPHQIFHPAWWVDGSGAHPQPFTVITVDDVDRGTWQAVQEPEWSRRYVSLLQDRAQKDLMIWPYHVPIGGIGNALDPELWSAVFWHAVARRSQPTMWKKGDIPETEFYSIIRPEVSVDANDGRGERSGALLDRLRERDYLLIAGEAASHCVLETVEDLIEELGKGSRDLQKVYLLEDCMSPVRHPSIDFAALTRQAFATFEKAGVRFMKSTDPLPF